jgi:hypothetical protein
MIKKFAPWIAVVVLILLVAVLPKPLEIPPTVSVIVTVLLGLALLLVLVLTLRGHLIGRRVVFLFIGASLTLPFFMKFEMPIKVTPEVEILFDAIKKLPPGSKVLAAFDYDPPSAPELQPMADAFMAYAFKHDIKVIIMGLWPQGPQQADLAVQKALRQPEIRAKNLKYGVDYVNLGFQSGNEFVIQRMGSSIRGMFPRDIYNTDYSRIPLLKGVENFSNIDFVFNLSSGYPGTVEWVQIAVDRFGVRVGAGNTAVQAPSVYPYLSSGKLTGLGGGMSGAWQFEQATNEPGDASEYVLPQSFSHTVVIGFIIIGNAALFVGYRRARREGV